MLDFEQPHKTCSLTFSVDDFAGHFLVSLLVLIKHSRSAKIKNGALMMSDVK